MSNNSDSKFNELVELTMKIKRYFQHADFSRFDKEYKHELKQEFKFAKQKFKMDFKSDMKMKFHNAHANFHDHDGSTMFQIEALKFIDAHLNCTMKELSEFLQISMSSATQLIERLVNSDLVERVDDESDRRIIRLKLTKKGKEHITECSTYMKEKMKTIFSNLDDKDIDDFVRITKKILSNSEDTNSNNFQS